MGSKFERIKTDIDDKVSINLDEISLNDNLVQVTIARRQLKIGLKSPMSFMLHQNFPNPFNAATTFRFVLSERGHVILKIFDTLGREIEKIVADDVLAGEHEICWNAEHLSSGLCF